MEDEYQIEIGPPSWPLQGDYVFYKTETGRLLAAKITKDDRVLVGHEMHQYQGGWMYHLKFYHNFNESWELGRNIVPCTVENKNRARSGCAEERQAILDLDRRIQEDNYFNSWSERSFMPNAGSIALVKYENYPLWPCVIEEEIQTSGLLKKYVVKFLEHDDQGVFSIDQMRRYTPQTFSSINHVPSMHGMNALENANRKAKQLLEEEVMNSSNLE